MIKCPICERECKTERSLKQHNWKAHTEAGKSHKPMLGKKQSSESVEKTRKANLGKVPWNKGISTPGRPQSEETKKKLSEHMKQRHKDGLAHNIGSSRWNNTPSWPEQFFMQVIENEFNDKAYKQEVPFHRFSLDFVWEHKKKVIEIDGEQHEQFEEQKRRDKEKDILLKEEGYELLRIRWKDMYNDTKTYIQIAKDFIGL